MKILVTGRSGQLAAASWRGRPACPGSLSSPSADRCSTSPIARRFIACIAAEKPDVVISTAAYTAVDGAEDEPALAHAVNVTGAATVAEATGRIGAAMIHLSTDYVFAGNQPDPYSESSPTGRARSTD